VSSENGKKPGIFGQPNQNSRSLLPVKTDKSNVTDDSIPLDISEASSKKER
jgi:hypothetical protein